MKNKRLSLIFLIEDIVKIMYIYYEDD